MKSTFAAIALLTSLNAFAVQEKYIFTATIDQVNSAIQNDDGYITFINLPEASSPRGNYAVGDILTGYIQYDSDLTMPDANAVGPIYVYSSNHEIFYENDKGFNYYNQVSGVEAQRQLIISVEGYSSLLLGDSLRWGTENEYNSLSFINIDPAFTGDIKISDHPTFNLQNFERGSISYWWLGSFSQPSYLFSANINSVTAVPELPAWILLLFGLAFGRTLSRRR
jgi:hypothetical protein